MMSHQKRTRQNTRPKSSTRVSSTSATSNKENIRGKMITQIHQLAVNDASTSTKVQTTQTCHKSACCLGTASTLPQRVVRNGFQINTNMKVSSTLIFLLFFVTTLVSSLPLGLDILLDIDESESTNSRIVLQDAPMREFSKLDMEVSAKEFLEKFGYVKPAEWNDVSPRTLTEDAYNTDIDEWEQSGDRLDNAPGSGDERSGQGTLDFVTWSAELISEEQYHEALIKYQRLNGLNATGQLDNKTASFMGRPRCGVPDRTALIKEHRTDELTMQETLPISTSSAIISATTAESITQTPYAGLIETHTAPQVRTETEESTTAGDEEISGDHQSNNRSARVKRSFDDKEFGIEYGNMQTVLRLEDIYGPISEAPLPDDSRYSSLKSVIDALRMEKLSKLNASKHREMLEELKSSVPHRPIAKLPGLVYRMVMETRATRNKRSISYMQNSGWLKPFANKVITWRLVEEWQTKRSLLMPSEIWYTIKLAFRMWSEIMPRNFREDRTSPITRVDILIGFGTNLHNRCRVPFRDNSITKEYAHAWPLPQAEIHFNDDQPFVSVTWDAEKEQRSFSRAHSGRTPISLLKVAIHEIGHTLGLPHINRRNSVMSPVYVPSQGKQIPEMGLLDRKAIQELYGTCKVRFDAVFDWVRPFTADDGTSKWRYNTYFFKRTWLWKYDNGGGRPGYGDPRFTKEKWRRVLDGPIYDPHRKIDGIVHIRDWSIPNGPIFIFIGDRFMEYDSTLDRAKSKDSLGRPYPRKISEGFPGIPSPIDTVFYKMSERMLYFFKGSMVYKFSWKDGKIMTRHYIPSYFRGWGGALSLPSNIDAAYYSYTYHAYYFFKGPFYWKMADGRDRARNKGIVIPQNSVGPMGLVASRWRFICDVDETEMDMST